MLRRWLGPFILGAIIAAITWHVALVAVPRGLMVVAERRVAKLGGFNHMSYAPVVTAASRAIVRPSPDLLYATCPFDVADGPVLVDIAPVVPAPYWSLSVFDHVTNVAFVRNNVQANGGPIRIAIMRDGQSAPAGYEPVRVPGMRGVALLRVLIDRSRPIDAIDAARHRSTCRRG